jgi:hypothetical protein
MPHFTPGWYCIAGHDCQRFAEAAFSGFTQQAPRGERERESRIRVAMRRCWFCVALLDFRVFSVAPG